MENWKDVLLVPDQSINAAIALLDASASQICLVVDEDHRLLGTITDGDVRRGILRGLPLDAQVSEVMKTGAITAEAGISDDAKVQLMKRHIVRQLPLVNGDGHVVGLSLLDEILLADGPARRDNTVLLMAGGYGKRLQPLTDDTPKPLLEVGSKPLLESILESFIDQNFTNFLMSVHFKADQVKSYFGDGSKWGVTIDYLEEDERLGTAGALSLIEPQPPLPLVIMNGDVLTKVNFERLLDFHAEQGTEATMCVRTHNFEIPFGVVTTDDTRITSIDEKPVQQLYVNAGIYVLEPDVLKFVPKGQFFDMPDLFTALIAAGHAASVFPVREFWLDIGHMDDFVRANDEYLEHFTSTPRRETA